MADEPPTAKRAKTRLNETFDNLVGAESTFVVVVGESQEEFELVFDTFASRSKLFYETRFFITPKKSKKGDKSPERPARLKQLLADEDPKIFTDYARCVYFAITPEAPEYDEDVDVQQAHFGRLFKLYLLVHKLGDLKAANLVIDEIYTSTQPIEEAPAANDVNMVYSRTTSSNPLRAFLCDMTIYGGCLEDWPESCPNDYKRGFIKDLTIEFMKIRSGHHGLTAGDAFSSGVLERRIAECHYHLHDDAPSGCPKCTGSRFTEVKDLIQSRRASFR